MLIYFELQEKGLHYLNCLLLSLCNTSLLPSSYVLRGFQLYISHFTWLLFSHRFHERSDPKNDDATAATAGPPRVRQGRQNRHVHVLRKSGGGPETDDDRTGALTQPSTRPSFPFLCSAFSQRAIYGRCLIVIATTCIYAAFSRLFPLRWNRGQYCSSARV